MIPRLWGVPPRQELPCNHPCSLMRADLPTLHRQAYWVAPKTDGKRVFLLASFVEDHDYFAMVDRTYTTHTVAMTSTHPETHSGTLLDGELVTHTDGTATYVVFDAVAVNGYQLIDKSFTTRLAAVRRVVAALNPPPTLTVVVKDWQVLATTNMNTLTTNSQGLPCDGLIFVPESGHRLRPGRARDIFKWKPTHTIDFRLHKGFLWAADRGTPVLASVVGVVTAPTLNLPPDGVVECTVSRANNQWLATPVRARPDKHHPNDLSVVKLTLQNIEENITLNELQ